MTDDRDLLLSSYDYELPPRFIAQFPVEPRHNARLLIVNQEINALGSVKHAQVWDWQDELRAGDLIVLNDTKVLKARLRVRRSGGGSAELLLLEPFGEGMWLCLARPGKRMRPGDHLWLQGREQTPIRLQVVSIDDSSGGRVIQFPSLYDTRNNIQDLLDRFGEVPLPPYIDNHDPSKEDRYQTRYAMNPGAVAAPTAGLHLSDELIRSLHQKGVSQTQVTLHIGLGTFRPLDKEDLTNLELHSEWVEVNQAAVKAVNECRSRGGRVIAVGTTSVRALEGAFKANGDALKPFIGKVNLVIKPGYRFGVIDGLITNFHLPKSSLLLLVSALIGRQRLLAIYREAIQHQYRFFSYGDAMWIAPEAVLPEVRPQATWGS